MSDLALSIVAPVFNEAAVVAELIQRCVAAGRATKAAFEVVIVDDASCDATPALLGQLCDGRLVRCVRLDLNAGQFGATQAGLRQARGRVVVVLDGDLQDPPEVIPSLFEALVAAGTATDCVLAVKARRHDPLWFRAGRFVYHALQRTMSRVRVPSGAGSYCAMSASLAARIGRLPAQRSNLAAVVAAMNVRTLTVPYVKAKRYDEQSRVGLVGLIREALSSLLLTGVAHRLMLAMVVFTTAAGLAGTVTAAPAVVVSIAGLCAAAWCLMRRRAFLTEAEQVT